MCAKAARRGADPSVRNRDRSVDGLLRSQSIWSAGRAARRSGLGADAEGRVKLGGPSDVDPGRICVGGYAPPDMSERGTHTRAAGVLRAPSSRRVSRAATRQAGEEAEDAPWMSDIRYSLRALPALFRTGYISALAYRGEFLVWILATNGPLVMLALWSAVVRDGPIGGFGTRQFTAYFLAALIVRQMTGSWVVWELNMEIREGTLSVRLLRPIHPFLAYAADNLAALPLRALIAVPLSALCIAVFAGDQITHDPVLWLLLPPGLAAGWLITFAAMLCIGALGFFWESSIALWDLWFGMFILFSGYLVPLALFPSWLGRSADALPFPYLVSYPVRDLLGLTTRAEALRALGIAWLYALAFVAAALALWKRGLRRYAAYGG
jgi:ABC-2 type transport system permease protein